jgi:uncharacterized membrane protein
MMSKILILLKKDISGLLYSIGLNKYKDEYLQKLIIFLIIVTSFGLFAMYYLFITYSELLNSGFGNIGILLGKKIAFGALFLINIYYVYGLLESKEYLLLNGLPISKKNIVISKILILYICDCIIEIIVFFPLCLLMGLSYLLVDIIISFLIMPLITIFICSSLMFGLLMIGSMIKLNSIIKAICVILGISLVLILLNNNQMDFKYVNTLFMFSEMFSYTFSAFILKFVIAILLGYFSIIILDIGVAKKMKDGSNTQIKKHEYTYHKKEKYKAVFIGEVKKYLELLPYVLNTALGLVLIILFSVNFFLFNKGIGTNFLGMPKGIVKSSIHIFPYIMSLVVGVCCSTQVSLSLEGNCVWIKKMIPVSNSAIYLSKVMVGFVLMVPTAVISTFLILRAEEVIIKNIFFTLITVILNILLMLWMGILIDIKFTNYNWNNPISVIKRGSGAIIYQIVNILINLIFILLVIKFKQSVTIKVACIFVTIILLSCIYKIIVKKTIPD